MIRAYPVGCIVAEDSLNKIHGYLFMHPYLQNQIQELNSLTPIVPENADCIYFHDLCVDRNSRGLGVADLLVKEGVKLAMKNGLEKITCVAVNGSHTYLEKKGFKIKKTLENYGGKSVKFMEMNLESSEKL